MSESFNLPLRPLIEKRDRPDSLPVDIAQINSQWGAFRDVNETALREKIEADKNKDPWSDEDDADKAADDLDTTERKDQLIKRRAEITNFAMQAHMETMFALDFVSLLLSKHTPRQAETSMSQFLKQVAPLGSLNSEVVEPPPKPDSVLKDTKTVARGWRMQNFNSAANKLLDCSSRLDSEVASETKYWNEVLAVKAKGWKVCRLPRERQALGVQYGFMESTPIFRDRALAALRRLDDGSLILDKGLVPSKAKAVRVRVRSHGKLTGCSKLPKPAFNEDTIEGRILQARDTLYEEELFHELFREARILGGQGVTTRRNLIQIPVSEEQEVLLDLVDTDQEPLPDEEEISSTEHDVIADALGHSTRILLSYAHRQNLRRRTQPPPPLTPKRRHTPEYSLLRPIMAYLQHNSHVRWLESHMKDIHQILQSADLGSEFTASPFSSVGRLSPDVSIPKVESLVHTFLMPFESTFTGKFVTAQSTFRVRIRTNVVSPPLGTHYEISVTLPQFPEVQPPSRIGIRDEAARVLTHFTMLDLLTAISQNSIPESPQADTSSHLNWQVANPHHGELLALSKAGQSRKMKLSLSREGLTAETYSVLGGDRFKRIVDNSPTLQSQTWSSNAASAKQPSLMEFVADVSKP
ncbi:RNA polymerase II mediator complex component SRB4 [Aspergillus steynii IBT 23096]|uniref:Mediator of RNA polymerase II transcription subunit 17 n=1 Tax=Aspergillus steynii IBT 23096 TaxID=1392250 RepID=A0A2I2G0Z5_9EURO|nr:RNA polymerase II mediator complex component SRB4 [Aspergillus steynii IBT 23096]PLB46549.1 RNA polymerase II mediator complex component SRB4 [Aspergillus steynii IBT 23096]